MESNQATIDDVDTTGYLSSISSASEEDIGIFDYDDEDVELAEEQMRPNDKYAAAEGIVNHSTKLINNSRSATQGSNKENKHFLFSIQDQKQQHQPQQQHQMSEKTIIESKYEPLIPGLFESSAFENDNTMPDSHFIALLRMYEQQQEKKRLQAETEVAEVLHYIGDICDVESDECNKNSTKDEDDDEFEIVFEKSESVIPLSVRENNGKHQQQPRQLQQQHQDPSSNTSGVNTSNGTSPIRERLQQQQLEMIQQIKKKKQRQKQRMMMIAKTQNKLKNNRYRYFEEPVTDVTDVDEEDNNEEGEDEFDTETVVTKNTSEKRILSKKKLEVDTDLEQASTFSSPNHDKKYQFFPFFRIAAASNKRRRRRQQQEASKKPQMQSHGAGNSALALNMKNIIIALLIVAEIIILSTIGTSYFGTYLLLQRYNFTDYLHAQAMDQQPFSKNDSSSNFSSWNNTNGTMILSNQSKGNINNCKTNEVLLQFIITFDSKPADIGISLKDASNKFGASMWNMKPGEAFQSFTLSQRTNFFGVCVSRNLSYVFEISDSKCNGLISSFGSASVMNYGHWEIMYDGVKLVEYDGNCNKAHLGSGTDETPPYLISECGEYSSCSYNIADSGFFGNCVKDTNCTAST